MPIEIRELHIRVTVDDEPKPNAETGTGGGGDKANVDMLVARCVEEVMRILERKSER